MALSPQTVPPAPMGLPPPQRGVRSLRIVPILSVVLLLAAAIAAIGWWSLTTLSEEHVRKAESGNPVNGQSASFTDLLAGAPSGTEIPMPAKPGRRVAAQQPQPPPAKVVATEAPKPAVDDNDTEATIAARRQAWQTYYQQAQQAQQARFQRQQAALSSGTVDTTQAASTAGAGTLSNPSPQHGPTDFFSSVASNPATDYSPYTLTDPISPYEIKAGDAIPAHLVSGLDSDSPGPVVGMVSKNVYDYATGEHILIPQGSRLFGTYATGGAYGQTRTMVAWTRVIFPGPCAQSLDLGAFAGSDETGQGGFSDITENHYGKIFLNALLVSLFSAGIQLSQPSQSAFQAYSPVQNAAGSVGQTMGQLGSEFARRGMDIPPTQRIRQGYNFVVLSLKDIAFDHPWVEGVCKIPHARPVVM
jgi:type IV secretion system protein TrbI